MCCAIAEWFETGNVPLYKYPEKLHAVIWSQGAIGWRQIFNERISKLWLEHQGNTKTSSGKVRMDYIWGVSIVETCLRMMIDLWEVRNEEVHGKEEATIQHKRFHDAIWSQGAIGWRQVFNGRISKLLLEHQGNTKTSSGKVRMDYIWGASIVETCLQMMVDLWEMRNEEVHGKEETTNQQKRKEKAAITVRALHKLDEQARPFLY